MTDEFLKKIIHDIYIENDPETIKNIKELSTDFFLYRARSDIQKLKNHTNKNNEMD